MRAFHLISGPPRSGSTLLAAILRESPAAESDRRVGVPGLHRIGRKVRADGRATAPTFDLLARLRGASFWTDAARSACRVRIV